MAKNLTLEPVDVHAALRRKYPATEYALMKEVSNEAGHSRYRSADFIAVSLWPSRGCAIIGFELKRSRYDFLKEMKNPEKAESIFKFCDYWYLITTGEEICQAGEIPET